MTLLLLFLAYGFSKRGNMILIAIRMYGCAFNQFQDFFLIDKKVLNPDSHIYLVANGMSTASAVSQSLGNIAIAVHQYSAKVLHSNCISKTRLERSYIRSLFSPSSDILSRLKEYGFIIHFAEVSIFNMSKYLSNGIDSTS